MADNLQEYEARWKARHRKLIDDLETVGHSLDFRTYNNGFGEFQGLETIMFCRSCRQGYRGRLLRRWRGLSPDRPCEVVR